MDTITKYRTIVKETLTKHADFANQHITNGLESHVILDDINNRFLLLHTGWQEDKRIRSIMAYIRLVKDKVWIDEDWTEDGIASDLLAVGVPKENIVLGFRHPDMRPYTEFAVA